MFYVKIIIHILFALNVASQATAALSQEDLKAYALIGNNITKYIGTVAQSINEANRKLLSTDGKFSDLTYKTGDNGKGINTHATRLHGLIQEDLTTPGTLSDKVNASIQFLAFDIPPHKSTNWWVHVIGVPQEVYPVVFFAYKHVDKDVQDQLINRYFSKTDVGPVWDMKEKSGRFSGANFASRAFVAFVQNYATETLESFFVELRQELDRELVKKEPWGGNGRRADGCLHQNNPEILRMERSGITSTVTLSHLYNNNHGKVFLKHMSKLMSILHRTPFHLGDDLETEIFGLFFECEQWLYRGQTVEPTSVGKFLDSGTQVTYYGARDAVKTTLSTFQEVDRFTDDVTSALNRFDNYVPLSEDDSLIGNRHFFVSDLMAHSRQKYLSTLRLLSRRTSRPESLPSATASASYRANANGYFTGDGFMTVLVSGKELGSRKKEIFQAYDWSRIPGATIQYTEQVPQASTSNSHEGRHSYNDRDFVGGASNGIEGVAFMDYSRPSVAVQAKKSWFFFDDVIVCLGFDITIPEQSVTESPVSTTINQVVYSGTWDGGKVNTESQTSGNKQVFITKIVDGMWYHHDDVGYVPLVGGADLEMELDSRLVDKTVDVFLDTFSLWINHGPSPCKVKYGYAILPAASKETTKAFAASPTTKILSFEDDLLAVCYSSEQYKVLSAAYLLKPLYKVETCVDTTPCFQTPITQICSDMPVLMVAKSFPLESFKKSLCPLGVKTLSITGSTPTKIIQVAFSDPAEVVSVFLLKLNTKDKSFPKKVSLPQGQLLGSSYILCYKV